MRKSSSFAFCNLILVPCRHNFQPTETLHARLQISRFPRCSDAEQISTSTEAPTCGSLTSLRQDCVSSRTTVTDTPSEVNAVVDLQALLRELQSATYRVGYLEAQLENSTEQVKLLPDLQAQAAKAEALATRTAELENELTELKRSWWYRFNAWLNGRP